MGFNSRILSNVNDLSIALKERGSNYFYETHVKQADSFRGPASSIEFIEKFIKTYNETDQEFHQLHEQIEI